MLSHGAIAGTAPFSEKGAPVPAARGSLRRGALLGGARVARVASVALARALVLAAAGCSAMHRPGPSTATATSAAGAGEGAAGAGAAGAASVAAGPRSFQADVAP